jgi:single-stranded-DNA-specific exonuclease
MRRAASPAPTSWTTPWPVVATFHHAGLARSGHAAGRRHRANKRLCIVADYDCDGATACAVALRGLRLLGARNMWHYIVPDRVVDGYGLTAPIAQRVKDSGADVLITVDNGIASMDGVAHARALGLQVLVTDHHLPAANASGERIAAADVIVNPNQPGCEFASKSIAGVGVMFYVLLALRSELRNRGCF